MARTYGHATRQKALPILVEEKRRLERALDGLNAKLDRYIRLRADEEITAGELADHRQEIEVDRAAWRDRLAGIAPLIADAELAARAAEAVADTLCGVHVADLDLQQRRWLLAQLDFTMALACEDWDAKSHERRYDVTSRWAGQALLGESATRDYVGSPNALAM